MLGRYTSSGQDIFVLYISSFT